VTWHEEPYFERAVTNALVVLNVGQGTYQVRRVVGVTCTDPASKEALQGYDIQRGVATKQYLLLEWDSEPRPRVIRMNGVSNSNPTTEQLETFREGLRASRARWPNQKEVDLVLKRMEWANDGGKGPLPSSLPDPVPDDGRGRVNAPPRVAPGMPSGPPPFRNNFDRGGRGGMGGRGDLDGHRRPNPGEDARFAAGRMRGLDPSDRWQPSKEDAELGVLLETSPPRVASPEPRAPDAPDRTSPHKPSALELARCAASDALSRARPGLERKPAAAPEPTREEDKEEENQMEMDEPEPEENGEDRRREGAEEYVAGDNDADKADNDGSDAQAELQEEGLEDGGEPAVKVAGHVTTRLVQPAEDPTDEPMGDDASLDQSDQLEPSQDNMTEEMRSQFEKQIQRADRFGTARPTVKEFYASLMIQTDNSSHAPNSADGRKGKGSAVEQGGRRRREPENGSDDDAHEASRHRGPKAPRDRLERAPSHERSPPHRFHDGGPGRGKSATLCRHYQQGRCSYGRDCAFSHALFSNDIRSWASGGRGGGRGRGDYHGAPFRRQHSDAYDRDDFGPRGGRDSDRYNDDRRESRYSRDRGGRRGRGDRDERTVTY